MIKVIEHGNKPKRCTCKKCQAVLEYLQSDVEEEYITADTLANIGLVSRRYIICPDCDSQIPV